MSWIPSGAFLMGSEDFYPEERPLHRVTVDGFWIDERPVTGGEFRRFVRDTGYVSFCERPIDPTDYPGADPDVLVPAPSYFARPQARSTCATSATGGSACRVPTGSAPRGRTRRSTGATVIRSCTSLTRTPRPTHPGLARNCQPKPNGCTSGQDSVVEPRVESFWPRDWDSFWTYVAKSANKKPRFCGAFLERMMGLEPTTFCMATRSGTSPRAALFRLVQV
jgi:hypothetical protein